MNRRGNTAVRAVKKPVIVLAGESTNDRKIMRSLLETFCPRMQGRILEVNDQPKLCLATGAALEQRVSSLARKIRARAKEARAPLACAFVHDDCDSNDGEKYVEARERVQNALNKQLPSAHYVLPMWEVESWLLLFPDALTAVVSSWNVPASYRGRDTALFRDPKRILREKVSIGGRKYQEPDGLRVIEAAIRIGCVDSPIGTNRSWDRFRSDANECCRTHLRVGRG